jgi:hypothetical protein
MAPEIDVLPPDFGPNGMLVKDAVLYPNRCGNGEYFNRPELIEGILNTIDQRHRACVMDCFIKNGTSCVISFYTDFNNNFESIISLIFMYIYKYLNNISDLHGCSINFDAKNNAIPPERILKIETINYDDNGNAILNVFYKISK